MLRLFFSRLLEKSFKKNEENIFSLIEPNSKCKMIDLGCDDGIRSMELAKKIGANEVFGVEIIESRYKKAINNGVIAKCFDLDMKFPLASKYFDMVYSNQVIEHLANTDLFLSECFRILKPGGYLIISTENLASWHNVVALILGFQPFSMTNYSSLGSIGNPFSIWKHSKPTKSRYSSWLHRRLFTTTALMELLKLHGFSIDAMSTAGYYPLPNIFARINPTHGHWLTIKARKP